MKADEFKRRRERIGTQAEVAKLLDISERTVIRYEMGEAEIPRTVELAIKQIEAENKG